jgi:hypothetical protein
MSRVVVHFNKVENPDKKAVRLLIKDGVVMNPKVEEAMKGNADFHIVGVRTQSVAMCMGLR